MKETDSFYLDDFDLIKILRTFANHLPKQEKSVILQK